MNGSTHQKLVNETAHAYMDLGDIIRLAILPTWITADLTISQAKALFMLAHYGSLAVSQLAGLLGIGSPAASVLVQQLVEQELVERTEDARDRRRSLVKLTPQGIQLIRGPHDQRAPKLYEWLAELGEEDLAGLLRGLSALTEIVRSHQAPAGELTGLVEAGRE